MQNAKRKHISRTLSPIVKAPDQEKRLWPGFMEKANTAKDRYMKEMRKLRDIYESIPKQEPAENREQVIETLNAKMGELGFQFKREMDALANEFIEKISGQE